MDAGDYRAHHALGTWYLYGRHVKASNRKAVSLFRQAAENDVAEAAFDLAVCYEKGEGVRKDLSKAAAFYLRALRCGDESAAEELRRMFCRGFGVEKNRMIADEFAAFEKTGPEKPGRRWALKGTEASKYGLRQPGPCVLV